jgi:hypothetical protein
MSSPRLSIVIPTRNRPRTLAVAVQTCLAQQFEDFEVVVSDNHSAPETHAVALACSDPRVRYVRTPAPLSMTDSIEFAVGHAAGEYVLVLPDDDGLMLHALGTLDTMLSMTKILVIRWDCVLYNWPDIAPQPYALPNALLIPLRAERACHKLLRCASLPMIQAAANGHVCYSELPMIFCSAYHRDVLDQVRRRCGGRIFRSRTPDVYGAFAISYVAGEFFSLKAPLGIAGTSGKSTGIARHFAGSGNAVDWEFRALNDADGHTQQSWVPDLPPIACAVADAFLHARAALFPDTPDLSLDRQGLIKTCLREAPAADSAGWEAVLAACRRSLADDPELLHWFDQTQAGRTFEQRSPVVRRQAERRYGGDYLNLDASTFGVADLMGAAQLCEQLLGYRKDGIGYRIEDQQTAPASSLTELEEKEAVLQDLIRISDEQVKLLRQQDRLLQDARAYQAHLEQQIQNLQLFRDRVKRPLRRGLPHLLGKVVGRFLRRPPEQAA